MRINQFLAGAKLGSRRKVEELILNGEIYINNIKVTNLAARVDTNKDVVTHKGNIIKPTTNKIYIMLNKPKGYICSVKDEQDRPTVLKLIKDIDERIYPVGRLDYNTEGLLLLTNDGEFTNKVTHPKNHIKKTYEVTLKTKPSQENLDLLRKGIELDGIKTLPAIISKIKTVNGLYVLNITISEGKNRQVRNMFKEIGCNVYNLKRISIGSLNLGDLEIKNYKILTDREINKIFI